jgi:hypothetical protein
LVLILTQEWQVNKGMIIVDSSQQDGQKWKRIDDSQFYYVFVHLVILLELFSHAIIVALIL